MLTGTVEGTKSRFLSSGALSLALGKFMPGGKQALNNPATREAAKKSFAAIVKSALHGARDEVVQEAIDGGFTHIASEMNKGRTFQQAATSYAEQFPQSALTSALLGGGTEAASTLRKGGTPTPQQPASPQQQSTSPQQAQQQPTPANPPASSSPQQPGTAPQQPTSAEKPAPGNPPAPSQQNSPASPQNSIPDTTTQNSSGPVPQPSTTANDGKQPPASPAPSGHSSHHL